jgi:hypothetical protein
MGASFAILRHHGEGALEIAGPGAVYCPLHHPNPPRTTRHVAQPINNVRFGREHLWASLAGLGHSTTHANTVQQTKARVCV